MAPFSLREYVREQRKPIPLPNPVFDVSSKTFIVTGSNVGLGFEASVHLTKMNPRTLLATSRDLAKCEHTRKAILQRVAADPAGTGSPEVIAWPLDMNTFENVRAFVDRLETERNGELNVLVANAGMYGANYTQSPDGWDMMLQVNYLSTALLSILLLPSLVKSSTADSPSRLVVVSSLAHYLCADTVKKIEKKDSILDALNGDGFSRTNCYKVTKLLEIMFVRELAARLPDPTPVVISAVNPGYCRSDILRDSEKNFLFRIVQPIIHKLGFVRSTEQGSRTLVHAAVASEERSMHGRYLSGCKITEESDLVLSPEGQMFSAKLWDETIAVLSKADSRVSDIIVKYLQEE